MSSQPCAPLVCLSGRSDGCSPLAFCLLQVKRLRANGQTCACLSKTSVQLRMPSRLCNRSNDRFLLISCVSILFSLSREKRVAVISSVKRISRRSFCPHHQRSLEPLLLFSLSRSLRGRSGVSRGASPSLVAVMLLTMGACLCVCVSEKQGVDRLVSRLLSVSRHTSSYFGHTLTRSPGNKWEVKFKREHAYMPADAYLPLIRLLRLSPLDPWMRAGVRWNSDDVRSSL